MRLAFAITLLMTAAVYGAPASQPAGADLVIPPGLDVGRPGLGGVYFIDAKTGWAAGNAVLQTIDGGKNWVDLHAVVKLPRGGNRPPSFFTLYFLSPMVGIAVEVDNTVMRTEDGGHTWTLVNESRSGHQLVIPQIQFVNPKTGWVVTSSQIRATIDGGRTWQEQPWINQVTRHGELCGMHFLDAKHGWVVGTDGLIMSTSDGGESWKEPEPLPFGDFGHTIQLYRVDFSTPLKGWIVGSQGTIVTTQNGGKTWLLHQIDPTYNLVEECAGGGDCARAMGMRFHDVGGKRVYECELFKTTNASNDWEREGRFSAVGLSAFHFPTPSFGCIVGRTGLVLITSDGGKTWTFSTGVPKVAPPVVTSVEQEPQADPKPIPKPVNDLADRPGIGPHGVVFGHGGNFKKIIFVCGVSTLTPDQMSCLRRELADTINKLRAIQSFNIIVAGNNAINSLDKAPLVMATPENKEKAAAFIDEKLAPAGGRPDIEALERAFAQKPELIYLLTDGDFANNNDAVLKARQLGGAHKVPINTIALTKGKGIDGELVKAMEQIAAESSGISTQIAVGDLK